MLKGVSSSKLHKHKPRPRHRRPFYEPPFPSYAGLQEIPFELWENGWAVWSKQRKRARMAQFIIDHLRQRKSANWIDISKGKFELCNWQEVAQEWYREKKRDSDITDATSILRKGLPRAFPGLIEVKSEAVRDGTQYIKRVFQATDPLLHDVLRCALQGDSVTEESPSSGDEDRGCGIKRSNTSPSIMTGGLNRPHPFSSSVSQPMFSIPSIHQQTPYNFYPSSIMPPDGMYNPFAGAAPSMHQQPPPQSTGSYSHTPSPGSVDASSTLGRVESSSTLNTAAADTTCNVDSAVESVNAADLLSSTFSPVTQIGSPPQSHQQSVDSGSGSMGAPSPFPMSSSFAPASMPSSSGNFSGLVIPPEMYDPVVTADIFSAASSVVSSTHDTLTSTAATTASPAEIVPSSPLTLPPPSHEPQLEDLCLGVSPKRSSIAGGEPLYIFSSGNIPIPDGPITLVFYSISLQQHKLINLSRANPFTYTAIIPSHPHPEVVNLHVVINGQPILDDQFEYYDATPTLNDFLTGDVHDQLSQLHFLLGEVLGGGGGGISLAALQGGAEASQTSSFGGGSVFTQHALNLMAFAARLGVPSLMRLLLQLPRVAALLEMTDKSGKTPAEIARAHGHAHIAECMTKIQERLSESSTASIDDLLDGLSPSKVRASDCIASLAMAIRRSGSGGGGDSGRVSSKGDSASLSAKPVRHQAEEQCIQQIVRSHLAQVQQMQYVKVVNKCAKLNAEYEKKTQEISRLESDAQLKDNQLKQLHKDRFALLKLVARWHLHASLLYHHLEVILHNMNEMVAKNLALKEQKKSAEEEKDKLNEALSRSQQEKGSLIKELEQSRSGDETVVLKEKYLEMRGLLEAAQLDLEETHKKKEWLIEEHKKVVTENRKLGETVKMVHEMKSQRDEALEEKRLVEQSCADLRVKNMKLEDENRQLIEASQGGEKASISAASFAESTPSLSDSAIGSIESQSTTESTQLVRETRVHGRRDSPPEMTSLRTKASLTKQITLGKGRTMQDLGFQISPAYFLQNVTSPPMEVFYSQGYDRILEINGRPVDAASIRDVEKILEKSLKKENVSLTLGGFDPSTLSMHSYKETSTTTMLSPYTKLRPKHHSPEASTLSAKVSSTVTPLTPPSSDSPHDPLVHAPRVVVIQRPESGELGFKVNGGNAVGVFVSAVSSPSIGLKKMDQLLELEGQDLRHATKEEVMKALTAVRGQATSQVKIVAQFNPDKYACLREIQHDSFYVRCQTSQLRFEAKDLKVKRGDVLHVNDSRYRKDGESYSYLAWKVNLDGTEVEKGTVPDSTIASRQFQEKHGIAIEPYQQVALQRPYFARPVALYGAQVDEVRKELVKLFPNQFVQCPLKSEYKDIPVMDKMVESLELVEYSQSDEGFNCVAVDDVKAIATQHRHCILDVSAFSIVQLQLVDLHPIVICLKSTASPEIPKIVEQHQAHTVIEAESLSETCQAVSEVVATQQLNRIWLSI